MARVAVGQPGLGRRASWLPLGLPADRRSLEMLGLLTGVVVWEIAGWLANYPWLPPFSRVLGLTPGETGRPDGLIQMLATGAIQTNLVSSLQSLVLGFAYTTMAALVLGALMARFRSVETGLSLYVNALLFAPNLVFAPIFFTIWGLADATRVAVVVLSAISVMTITFTAALRTADPALMEMARTFGADERRLFFKVVLPASLPTLMAGLRLGMGRCVKGMINGEQFIAYVGLGALVQRYGSQFDATKVFALVLVILFVAMTANWLVETVERRVTRWTD